MEGNIQEWNSEVAVANSLAWQCLLFTLTTDKKGLDPCDTILPEYLIFPIKNISPLRVEMTSLSESFWEVIFPYSAHF